MMTSHFELSNEQKNIMNAAGNMLVCGGPGSGKTTVAILKARALAAQHLKPWQKIIFLSFSRSSVARIVEALSQTDHVIKHEKTLIEIGTYHAFFWRVIKSHGYLLGLPQRLSILTPSAEAIALSETRNSYGSKNKLTDQQRQQKERDEYAERERLAYTEGKLCFDLFSNLASSALCGSQKLRDLYSDSYPFIILDEFQDTDNNQWECVKALGLRSTIIALADPEQRIYDFKGADPNRLNHFNEHFQPSKFDLAAQNYRSAGTQITMFGNDVLRGRFQLESYQGITILTYPANQNQAFAKLKSEILKACRRLSGIGDNSWSLAILVPTKKMTRAISDYLRSTTAQMPAIRHSPYIEVEGAILAAEVIAFLLQPKALKGDFTAFVQLVCRFFKGRGGDNPTKNDLNISNALEAAIKACCSGKKIRKNSIILPLLSAYKESRKIILTGDPDTDWKSIRTQLENGNCTRLKEIGAKAHNLSYLNRGTTLRRMLSEQWRISLSYIDALECVRRASIQDHFASSQRPETGVVVMNMHKAKGKQFDEVIIFEGWPRNWGKQYQTNPDRIARRNSATGPLYQYRQNFMVSITRAKQRTTILTPDIDPCILLDRQLLR